MDDGMDDGTNGWKGRPPPDRLRILYIKIYKMLFLKDIYGDLDFFVFSSPIFFFPQKYPKVAIIHRNT